MICMYKCLQLRDAHFTIGLVHVDTSLYSLSFIDHHIIIIIMIIVILNFKYAKSSCGKDNNLYTVLSALLKESFYLFTLYLRFTSNLKLQETLLCYSHYFLNNWDFFCMHLLYHKTAMYQLSQGFYHKISGFFFRFVKGVFYYLVFCYFTESSHCLLLLAT